MSAGKGKRALEVLKGTTSSSSDEDSPRILCGNIDHDCEDYDLNSPSGSSTVSGGASVTLDRHPGFQDYAQIRRQKKKKKPDTNPHLLSTVDATKTDSTGHITYKPLKHQVAAKAKTHRDPVPMRMRALPQSMWQEPNVLPNVSPATVYPVLPPLVTREGDDITGLRPVTPPEEREERETAGQKTPKVYGFPSNETRRHSRVPERTISVANPELLMKLFENVDSIRNMTIPQNGQLKKGRIKKSLTSSQKSTIMIGKDPYMVENITDTLFPQLSLERRSVNRFAGAYGSGTTMVHLQPLSVGDKTIMLPSLSIDQNYPQMLTEVVAHI